MTGVPPQERSAISAQRPVNEIAKLPRQFGLISLFETLRRKIAVFRWCGCWRRREMARRISTVAFGIDGGIDGIGERLADLSAFRRQIAMDKDAGRQKGSPADSRMAGQ